MTDRGTYVEHEGRPAVRFVRRYPHPAERVWAAVSEPAELRHWFPSHGDELHLTVEPDGEGAVLTLLNVLEARDAAARNAAGWTVCLAELDAHLGGPRGATAEPWPELYAAYVAAGVPSGAPIPG